MVRLVILTVGRRRVMGVRSCVCGEVQSCVCGEVSNTNSW